MRHHASRRFWRCYRALPREVRGLADRNYEQLNADPSRRSLHFKKIGDVWSVRVGLHYRALATETDDAFVWFWIGSHAEYDTLLGKKPANRASQPTSRAKRKATLKRRRGPARG